MTLLVAAIGGNSISPPNDPGLDEMRARIATTASRLADLVGAGYKLVVTHGNGPQVGNILLQNEEARHRAPPMPLDVCVAQSQAQIGYLLQQSLQNEFATRGQPRAVASVVTQVVVDPDDPAFGSPTKPVGPMYEAEQEVIVKRAKGWSMARDPRGGWRRLVPSPRPLEIVEKDLIRRLLATGDASVLIAAGGGGIPVIRHRSGYRGVEAVIDKDLASAVLAKTVGAEILLIVTDVPQVALRYGRPDQTWLSRLSVSEARHHFDAGEFPPGSMGPKIEAVLQFLETGGRRAVIADLDHVLDAMSGRAGTQIP